MSTLISPNGFGLRRPEPARARQPQRDAAPAPALAPAQLQEQPQAMLDRLAAWAERQPMHRRFGSDMLVGLRPH